MNFSLLTYNTLFNNGVEQLDKLVNEYYPDLICLQEAYTDDKSVRKIEKFGYKMADYSNAFIKFGHIYGVITFYNPKTFIYQDSFELKLGTNIGEYFFQILRIILGYNQPKSILETDFIHKSSKKKVSICNVHLYVIGSNQLRINHINKVLKSINLLEKSNLIIAGDFNYFPYKRKGLEKMMSEYGLKEATANIRQTMQFSKTGKFEKYNLFQRTFLPLVKRFVAKQIKTDYSFYRGLKLIKTERIESRSSDHYPIISQFSL